MNLRGEFDLRWTRTIDPIIKSDMLYQLSYEIVFYDP